MENQLANDAANTEPDDDSPDGVFGAIAQASRYVALLTAWVATSGSLYMSEALGWVPCLFCWYQRILMYPIALLLTVGLLKRDNGVNKYILALSIPGIVMAAYHYLYQKSDVLRGIAPCTVGVPCSADYLNWLNGLVTIPFLALIAFLIITFCMVASRLGETISDEETNLRPTAEARLRTVLPVVVIIAVVVISFLVAGISTRSTVVNAAQAQARITEQLPPTPDSAFTARGKLLYDESCAACHGLRGEGTPAGRALTDSAMVKAGTQDELLAFIRMGRAANDAHNTTGLSMPAGGGRADASDYDVAAIIAYIRSLAGVQ